MIVSIKKYGPHMLRKHSIDITKEDSLLDLSTALLDTLKKYNGIGLSAPQIGVMKNAFVIDTTALTDNNENNRKSIRYFFNPVLIWESHEKAYHTEGCLSLPGIYEEVLRSEKIFIEYLDENFNIAEDFLEGIESCIFQHELDHLHGILFIDRISPLRRKLIEKKLNTIK